MSKKSAKPKWDAADPYGVLRAAASVSAADIEAALRGDAMGDSGGATGDAANAAAPADTQAAPFDSAAMSIMAAPRAVHAAKPNLADMLALVQQMGAGADIAPPTPAPTPAPDEDACPACGGRLAKGDFEFECEGCHAVVEGDTTAGDPADDEAAGRAKHQAGRLRIVGPNSGSFQPDLDRSSSTNYAETQLKMVLEEYKHYRQQFIEAGGAAVPLNAIELAAHFFHEVQRQAVKRSLSKRVIMAAALQNACVEKKFVLSKADAARFMRLRTKGTARGDNYLRMLKADGHISLNVNQDPCAAHVATAFALLLEGPGASGGVGAGGPGASAGASAAASAAAAATPPLKLELAEVEQLQAAAEAVVRRSVERNIGMSSIVRSKVMGATYAVLVRHARAHKKRELRLPEFCQKCKIRRNTCDRFLTCLAEYHSHFADIYAKFKIFAGPLA